MSDKNDTSSEGDYSSSEFINDEENLMIKSNGQINLIQNYIINKLLHFYNFNEKLMHLIKRKYNNKNFANSNYFQEYYIINSNWMKNYLQFYNYKKVSRLIKREANGELKLENLYKTIKIYGIEECPGENDINKNNLNFIEFQPNKENIPENVYVDDINDKIIEYFNNFIILDKDLYDEIKQDNNNPEYPNYTYALENKIDICLVDNIFIYKITENVLGIGILPEFLDDNQMLIFKIDFLLILFYDYNADKDEQYNSNTEIKELFRTGDLETYLVLKRFIRFENENLFRQIDMKIVDKKIGLLYNIGNFQKEMYWKRTKEEFAKKQKQLEEMKIVEIKKKEEKIKLRQSRKLKEEKEKENLRQTEEKIMEKKKKEKEMLKLKVAELERKILIDCEKAQDNELFKEKLKKLKFNNLITKSNDEKTYKKIKLINNKIHIVNKNSNIFPEIPENKKRGHSKGKIYLSTSTNNHNNNKIRPKSSHPTHPNSKSKESDNLIVNDVDALNNKQRNDIEKILDSSKVNSKEKENPKNNIPVNQDNQIINAVMFTIKTKKNNNLFHEIIEKEKKDKKKKLYFKK